jgi:methyl-accepting chemotaxis protein
MDEKYIVSIAEQIKQNAERVNNAARYRLEFIDDLSGKSESIGLGLGNIRDGSAEINKLLLDSRTQIEDIVGAVEQTARYFQASSRRVLAFNHAVDKLARQLDAVDEISQRITGIAKQTHMVSLNAMIEASREQGANSVFTVVAGEVRALAATSKGSASEITGTLSGIKAASADLADDFALLASELAEQAAKAAESLERVHKIDQTLRAGIASAGLTSSGLLENMETLEQMMLQVEELRTDTLAAIDGSATNLKNADLLLAAVEGPGVAD